MLAESSALAALVRERLLEPDIARSARGAPPAGRRVRLESRLWDKLTDHI